MATLEGQSIASSYEQLLHVDTDGGGNTTTLVPVKDGDNGTTFALQLSTTTAVIDNPTDDSSTQGGILRLQSDDGALMQSGSRLGVIEFAGAEDSNNNITVGGRIESVTDAAWSDTENGADMVFYTTDGNASQSEVLRLTADNYVGMGINPEYPLHVETSRSGNNVAFIKNTHASNGYGLKVFAGDDANVKSFEVGNYTGGNLFYIKGNGDAVLTGDLIMGTSGKGISFAATSDAGGMTSEVLDDYEEGTWSPVVSDGTNPMTMDGSNDTGYYTKVGNLVTVTGYFKTTSLGSASGDIRITGLPFTVANNAAALSGGGAGHGDGLAITAGHTVSYLAEINTTYILLKVWDATTGTTAMQASEWSADGKIMIGFSYRAA